jgi:hypothetical protein
MTRSSSSRMLGSSGHVSTCSNLLTQELRHLDIPRRSPRVTGRSWHDGDNSSRQHGQLLAASPRWPLWRPFPQILTSEGRSRNPGRLVLLYGHVAVWESDSASASSAWVPRQSPNKRERNTNPSISSGCRVSYWSHHYKPWPHALLALVRPMASCSSLQ